MGIARHETWEQEEMVAVMGKEQLSPAVYIPLGLVSWKILCLPDSQVSSEHVYYQARPRGLF